MSRPFFSVLMPVYNAAWYLPEVLRDLERQTWKDFEVVAVDDGSTDESVRILEAWGDARLRLLQRDGNGGLVAALNDGLAAARGQWVARQDADDRCDSRRLEKQAGLIQQRPGAVLYYSRARLLDGRGWWRGSLRPPLTDANLRWDLGFRNSVPHTSAIFPLELVREEAGGYEGDNVTADFALWSRLLRRGRAEGLGEPLVGYRIHGHSIMGRANAMRAGAGARERATHEALAAILRENLREWAGAQEEEGNLLAAAWLSPDAVEDWEEYFVVRERLARAHRVPEELIAEEDYTLWHRCRAISRETARHFRSGMRKVCPERSRDWPWCRWGLSCALGVLTERRR